MEKEEARLKAEEQINTFQEGNVRDFVEKYIDTDVILILGASIFEPHINSYMLRNESYIVGCIDLRNNEKTYRNGVNIYMDFNNEKLWEILLLLKNVKKIIVDFSVTKFFKNEKYLIPNGEIFKIILNFVYKGAVFYSDFESMYYEYVNISEEDKEKIVWRVKTQIPYMENSDKDFITYSQRAKEKLKDLNVDIEFYLENYEKYEIPKNPRIECGYHPFLFFFILSKKDTGTKNEKYEQYKEIGKIEKKILDLKSEKINLAQQKKDFSLKDKEIEELRKKQMTKIKEIVEN